MPCSISPLHLCRISFRLLAAGLLALSITGCVQLLEPRQSNLTYYLLNSTSEDALSTDTTGVKVGLRRPRLASYLDATRIVTRRGPNEVHFSDFQRWGEELGRAINRVVALNLKAQTDIQSAETVPWPKGATFDYVIQLEVLRFEGKGPEPPGPETKEETPIPKGRSQMAVQWTIYGPEGRTVRARGFTRQHRDDWPVDDYGALVSRLNASLEVLANDIASRIATLSSK